MRPKLDSTVESRAILTDDNENSFLLWNSNSFFTDSFENFCNQHAIPSLVNQSSDPWVRDYFILGHESIYIRNKYENWDGSLYIDNLPLAFSAANHTFWPKMASEYDRNVNALKQKYRFIIKSSQRALEGGNHFVVETNEGLRVCFLNEVVAVAETMQFESKCDRLQAHSPILKSEDILKKYKKILGVDRITFLPAICYHLDLQMAYIGNGTFLVHSFVEMKKHFKKEFLEFNKIYQAKYGVSVLDSLQPILDKVSARLEAYGCHAVQMCGSLYGHDYRVWDGRGLKSQLLNGIHLRSNTNSRDYYLTTDTPHRRHKLYLRKICRAHNVFIHFIKANKKTFEQTMEKISDAHGSIRCQTTFLPYKHAKSKLVESIMPTAVDDEPETKMPARKRIKLMVA